MPDRTMSKEQELLLQAQIAEDQRIAAEARTNLLERQRELTAIRQAAQAPAQATTPQATVANPEAARKTAEEAAKLAALQEQGKRLVATADPEHRRPDLPDESAVPTPTPPTDPRLIRFQELVPASGVSHEKLKTALVAHGVTRFRDLTPELQDILLGILEKKATERKAAEGNGNGNGGNGNQPPKN
jgi:hypothetical protein